MPYANTATHSSEGESARDRYPFGTAAVAVAVIWLALYGYMAASAAIGSFSHPIAVAHAIQ